MVISEATNYVTGGVYREIVSDEKLVFTWGAVGRLAGARRGLASGQSPCHRDADRRSVRARKSRVRVELPAGLSEEGVREWLEMGIRHGWRQTVDRLAAALRSSPAPV